jgi:hypothetical protein
VISPSFWPWGVTWLPCQSLRDTKNAGQAAVYCLRIAFWFLIVMSCREDRLERFNCARARALLSETGTTRSGHTASSGPPGNMDPQAIAIMLAHAFAQLPAYDQPSAPSSSHAQPSTVIQQLLNNVIKLPRFMLESLILRTLRRKFAVPLPRLCRVCHVWMPFSRQIPKYT